MVHPHNDEARALQDSIDSQKRQADADAAKKLDSLTRQRLDIQRSFGAPQFYNPDAPKDNASQDEGV